MLRVVFDVLIIGGGPPGISAIIYSARKRVSIAIIIEKFGVQLLGSLSVENFLGFEDEIGINLNNKFVKIGSTANSSFIDDLSFNRKLLLDNNRNIMIDKMCRINIKELFDTSDVTYVFGKQAIISAEEGAKSALAVYEELKQEFIK